MENTGDLNSVIQEKYDELRKEITRLQEKYDENGYDFSPMVKLQRIEQHVDYLISLKDVTSELMFLWNYQHINKDSYQFEANNYQTITSLV